MGSASRFFAYFTVISFVIAFGGCIGCVGLDSGGAAYEMATPDGRITTSGGISSEAQRAALMIGMIGFICGLVGVLGMMATGHIEAASSTQETDLKDRNQNRRK